VIRLHFVVEGQTEEAFVRDVLAPHLANAGVFCDPRCAQTGRKRGRAFKGGVLSYPQFQGDLSRWMREDQGSEAHFTTMVDLYRLPDDFPGYEDARSVRDGVERAIRLEACFGEAVAHHRGQFIPHIQPFEFEALLFAAPQAFAARFLDQEAEIEEMTSIPRSFPSPEHIDDAEPPSKRILTLLPGYDKVADGPVLAAEIGLDAMREQCEHFDQWIRRLEGLGQDATAS
jgi:hypothetical protein